ncbi:MAG: 3-deoxy-8-phosphooctulonate synthase [Acidobacteria bacterium]|nr:MAG: 3-deoxy-8-phosphooctulonate synthase [Acidobacteriota bacterium]
MTYAIPFGKKTLRRGGPLLLIAGPCVIESKEHCTGMAKAIKKILAPYQKEFIWVFKSSFDKANRSSIGSQRGPGLEEGLRILKKIRNKMKVPVITDIHLPSQAAQAAKYVDALQIPAFLCRQTDLVVAAAQTGLPVNIKKGQFLAPWDMKHPIVKVRQSNNLHAMVTERGTSFGYNNLVVDFTGFQVMRDLGVPLIFDATHSVQLPGGLGNRTGGRREMAPVLARAAVAAGVDGLFMEVHSDPDKAWSDGPNQLNLPMFEEAIQQIVAIRKALHGS